LTILSFAQVQQWLTISLQNKCFPIKEVLKLLYGSFKAHCMGRLFFLQQLNTKSLEFQKLNLGLHPTSLIKLINHLTPKGSMTFCDISLGSNTVTLSSFLKSIQTLFNSSDLRIITTNTTSDDLGGSLMPSFCKA